MCGQDLVGILTFILNDMGRSCTIFSRRLSLHELHFKNTFLASGFKVDTRDISAVFVIHGALETVVYDSKKFGPSNQRDGFSFT